LTGIGLRGTLTERLEDAGLHGRHRDEMADRMAGYLMQSRADNTVKKYNSSFEHFKTYCEDNSLVAMPALPISVAMYMTQLMDHGKSNNVVSSVFYSIKWVHSINGVNDPTENNIVKQLLEASKRVCSKPVHKKDVLSSEMIQTLCLMYKDSTDVIDVRDLAMIILGYAGFMRMNEISELRCNDVQFKSDHFVINVRHSKTDIYRNGSEIIIAKGTTTACPYGILTKYMSLANLSNESNEYLFKPAFRSKAVSSLIKKDKKLSYTRARECIVKKLKLVGPELDIGTHSLRASGATNVANASSVSERCLKIHGRWKTDIAKDGYVQDSIDKRLSVTKTLNL